MKYSARYRNRINSLAYARKFHRPRGDRRSNSFQSSSDPKPFHYGFLDSLLACFPQWVPIETPFCQDARYHKSGMQGLETKTAKAALR